MTLYYLRIKKDKGFPTEGNREGKYVRFDNTQADYKGWTYDGDEMEKSYSCSSIYEISKIQTLTEISNTLDTEIVSINFVIQSMTTFDSYRPDAPERKLDDL